MTDYVIKLSLPFEADPDPVTSEQPRATLLRMAALLRRVATGTVSGASTVVIDSETTSASGTLTLSTASGTVGGTIGGTAVTVSASGGDTTTAAALATAINANSTVNKYVSATSALGVVTITAIQGGTIGNGITLVASGTGVTASAAKLANGATTRTTLSF